MQMVLTSDETQIQIFANWPLESLRNHDGNGNATKQKV